MCCFVGDVRQVFNTNIFASLRGNQQVLVYQAHIATDARNAMVLPVPIAPGAASTISLINLIAHPTFFDFLAEYMKPPGFGAPRGAPEPLPVVRVGSFDASIVPTIDDFARLSSQFVLGGGARQRREQKKKGWLPWGQDDAAPQATQEPSLVSVFRQRYPDHAFVVYQLAPGAGTIHPFAFSFVSRYPGLFFPTLHVHHGDAPAQANFDHTLYAQHSALRSRSDMSLRSYRGGEDLAYQLPFLDPDARIDMDSIRGVFTNQDTYVPLSA